MAAEPDTEKKRRPPLVGIRVLDLFSIIAAPVTATMLGDFGVEVVKVEKPGTGNFMRRSVANPGGRSYQWVQDARNKQSVTIDLHREEGCTLVRRMLPHFDVVVTNFRPPTLDRCQLGPDALRAAFPSLIVLYVTGYSHRPVSRLRRPRPRRQRFLRPDLYQRRSRPAIGV